MLFRLTRGRDYWVVVTFQDSKAGIGEVVSAPLRVRMPTAGAAGTTRPPYGSPWLYKPLQKVRSSGAALNAAWGFHSCVETSFVKAPLLEAERAL